MKDQKKDQKSKVTEEQIQELTLLLIFNSCWEEDSRKEQGKKVLRAWKGYKFEILDKMHEEKSIYQPRGTKSLLLLEYGKQKAEEIMIDFFESKDSEIEVTPETIQALHLLLIYLTGSEEDDRINKGKKVYRSWKGYNFEILNALQEQNYIWQIPGGKSLLITDEGKQKCIELQKKYFVEKKSKAA